MSTLVAIVAAGDPVDPDLVSLLHAEGLDTLDAIHALGRAHWIAFFADRAGFTRDFVEMLATCGLTWETASSAERFQCSLDEVEIGVPAMMVAESLGAATFAEVFRSPPDVVRAAMAKRDGMLGELEDLLARHGKSW